MILFLRCSWNPLSMICIRWTFLITKMLKITEEKLVLVMSIQLQFKTMLCEFLLEGELTATDYPLFCDAVRSNLCALLARCEMEVSKTLLLPFMSHTFKYIYLFHSLSNYYITPSHSIVKYFHTWNFNGTLTWWNERWWFHYLLSPA